MPHDLLAFHKPFFEFRVQKMAKVYREFTEYCKVERGLFTHFILSVMRTCTNRKHAAPSNTHASLKESLRINLHLPHKSCLPR